MESDQEKPTPRWKAYYERNKEMIREKNLKRYYDKKNSVVDAEAEAKKQERLNEIVSELRNLIPTMIKPPRKKKVAIVNTIVESVQ
jgi:hypothetical protein